MSRNDPQINVRLPVELKERLEAAAVDSHRSFKAEIVARLEWSFAEDLRAIAIEHFAIALGLELDRIGREFGVSEVVADGFYGLANRLHNDSEAWDQEETQTALDALVSYREAIVAEARGQRRELDLQNSDVQDAMVMSVRELMGTVAKDMREEARVNSGLPLLLKWFDANPAEREAYDELPDAEQDEFVREKAQQLWLEHLNHRRDAKRVAGESSASKASKDKPNPASASLRQKRASKGPRK